jgi:hypothetical protein
MKTAKKNQTVEEARLLKSPPKLEIELGVIETEEFLSIVNPSKFKSLSGVTEEWEGESAQVQTGDLENIAVLLKTGMGVFRLTSLSDSEGEIQEYRLWRV